MSQEDISRFSGKRLLTDGGFSAPMNNKETSSQARYALPQWAAPPGPPTIQPPDTSTVPVGSVLFGATRCDCASCQPAQCYKSEAVRLHLGSKIPRMSQTQKQTTLRHWRRIRETNNLPPLAQAQHRAVHLSVSGAHARHIPIRLVPG